jgi:integrase
VAGVPGELAAPEHLGDAPGLRDQPHRAPPRRPPPRGGPPGLAAAPSRAGRPGPPPWPYLLSYAPDASRPVSPDTLSHRWRTLCGGRARFHDLRHFAATVALGAGVPVRDVTARLGHASASTTLDRYAHALPAGDQRAAAALEAALEPDVGGNEPR